MSKAFQNVIKLRDWVSVKDFGAIGNGVADDASAIQSAIDYAGSNKVPIKFPKGEYLVGSTLVLPISVGPSLGNRPAIAFLGENHYDTSGLQNDVQVKIKAATPTLFKGSTPGTFADPAPVQIDFRDIGFYAVNNTTNCFDLLNLQYSRIYNCWFRNFNIVLRGKVSVLTRIENSTFLNCKTSAIDNTMLTGSQKSCSDFWICRNYISGSIDSVSTVLINIFFANYGWIEDNFIDFGVIGFAFESGQSVSISGNQFDYCPTALRLNNANYYSIDRNRFTNIRKTNASKWTLPTTAMQNNNWISVQLRIGSKNIDLSGNIFENPDKEVLMQESGYSNIFERGSVRQSATAGSIIDMTGRSVGALPDGTQFSFENYENKDYTNLPTIPETSYPGHKIFYYGSFARMSPSGVWLDANGSRLFGKTDLISNGDFSSNTGWTFTASETIVSEQLVITANLFSTFYKTLSVGQTAGTYLLIWDFVNYTSGSIRVQNRNAGVVDQQSAFGFTLQGVKYWEFTATGPFDEIAFIGGGVGLTAVMDNVYLIKMA